MPRPGAPGLIPGGPRRPRPPAHREIVSPPIRRPAAPRAAPDPLGELRRARDERRPDLLARRHRREPRTPAPRRASRTASRAPRLLPAPSAMPACQRRQRSHRHHRLGQRLGERARRRQADPQPGERPGPDAHRDQVHALPPAGPLDRRLDSASSSLGVAGAPAVAASPRRRSSSASPSRVTATADVVGRGVEADDERHRSPPGHVAKSPHADRRPRGAARPAARFAARRAAARPPPATRRTPPRPAVR